ncbi:MAG: hypothetical protein EU551_03305 [Promethearchaeota archaeon]|nr:MAG: hypothetical protein EU551_03305 [Candidatus Lokiarchaeota archaeon]
MEKNSGLTIYTHNFKESTVDGDLLSGFLTAIQQFGSELSEEKTSTSVKKIEYHGFEINLEDGNKIRTALILKGKGLDLIKEKLIEFVSEYEKRYEDELSKWSGNISAFIDSPNLINEYFGKEESTEEGEGLEKKKSQPLMI